MGDGADLQIYHDSLNSYISDTGTGDLTLIGAGNIVLENSTLGTNSAVFDTTGGIDLYWGGAGTGKRLEIAGYGATITGDLYLSGDLFTGGEGKIGEDVTTRNLDVTGISTLRGTLSVAGVTTFTSLVDADSGIDVTGHSELDTVYVSGLSTFVGDAKFDGNVSIAGTLTKEDVTNIDSVGIVTAGKGLRVTTGGIVVTAGITTFNDDVQFPGAAYNILWDQATSKFKFDDSAQLVFGSASGGDMKLFHQSGNSTIRNETGQFRIAGNDIRLQTQNHSEDYLLAVDGGSVSIFYNDIKRLETSSSGVDITDTLNVAGILTAATANVTGTLTAGLIDGGSY